MGRPRWSGAWRSPSPTAWRSTPPRAYTNLSFCALNLRDYPLASRYLVDGIRYCTGRDLDLWGLYMLVSEARADFEQGRWAEATRTAEVVLRDPRTAPVSRINALAVVGRIRARRGDPGVWPPLDEALALATVTGELQRLGPVAVARAEAAWLQGDPAAAQAVVEDALDLAERVAVQTWPWPTGELAFWLWRLGGPDRLPTDGLPDAAAEPFALQMAGAWDAAADRWRALACPYEAAAALADSDQEPQLRAALTELERLGARPLAAAVTRKLRELGVRDLVRGPRPTTRANPANLTARETEVLALVAEGLRNADIGRRLFVSPKTVDHHVSAILAKLGVRTRGEAAWAATRLGISG